MKRKSRRRLLKQARQWTYYVEALKRSLDSLYEICRHEKNVSACREVMLYLNKGNRDFEALIDSFLVEKSFEDGLKPSQSVAWEIRQTGGIIEARESETESSCSMISTDSLIDIMPYSPALISDTIKKITESFGNCETNEESGWHLVQSRRSRRYSSDSMGSYTTQVGGSPEPEKKTLNVYERLAGNGSFRNGRKSVPSCSTPSSPLKSDIPNGRKGFTTGCLLYPKSAMDLPQTRSSMAKIAYSRRILWEQHRSTLAEKMRKRHRQEQSRSILQRPLSSQSSHDVKNTSRHSSPLRAKSTISLELESIHEANEDELIISSRSEPTNDILASLDDDEEWRALTVEEESLAQEELSLKKEIEEEESTSIDAELRRQVEAEAAIVEALEKENSEPTRKKTSQLERFSWKDALDRCTAKLQRQGITKWSDAVDKKISHFRPPGAIVEMHEKLMSPSRKRNGNCSTPNVEEKLQRADAVRQQLLDAKSLRVKELSKKIEQVKSKQLQLIEKKRMLFDTRMEKAEQNRQKTLEEIVRKAHDGDQRVLEVNFFKNMEESSVRMLMELKEGEAEARKQMLEEVRLKRSEQNAAKRVAAEKRREKQNEERSKQFKLLAEKKRESQMLVDAQRHEAERLRQEQTREKMEKHQKRLATIKANQISDSRKLLNEITRRQEECAKRHEESLEVVKKRAIVSAQGLCSNRSSMISSCSDDCDGPQTFCVQFGIPPDFEERESTRIICKSCEAQMKSALEAVSHAIFSSSCSHSLDNSEGASSKFEVCKSVVFAPPAPDYPAPVAVNAVMRKKRSKLKQKFIEMCEISISNIEKQLDCHSGPQTNFKTMNPRSFNLLAKCTKAVNEVDDFCHQSERLFSESDWQSLFRIANETLIVVEKSEKNGNSQKVIADLWQTGAILNLFKLFLAFNSSSKTSFCERTLEVLEIAILHSSVVASAILYSPIYLSWMDCIGTALKELMSEEQKASDESERLMDLHNSFVRLTKLNSVLFTNVSTLPTFDNERCMICVRYLSTFGFYANLERYTTSVIFISKDLDRADFLFALASLTFVKNRSSLLGSAVDYRSSLPQLFPLFQHLVDIVYRLIPPFTHRGSMASASNVPGENSISSHVLSLLNAFCIVHDLLTQCYISEMLKTPNAVTSIQLLHILKFATRNCLSSAQANLSGADAISHINLIDLETCMGALCRFISLGREFQVLCAMGHENSMLYILATLDLQFYSKQSLQKITAPPTLALLYKNGKNIEIFEKELSIEFLVNYLKRIKNDERGRNDLLALLSENDFEVIVNYFASVSSVQ